MINIPNFVYYFLALVLLLSLFQEYVMYQEKLKLLAEIPNIQEQCKLNQKNSQSKNLDQSCKLVQSRTVPILLKFVLLAMVVYLIFDNIYPKLAQQIYAEQQIYPEQRNRVPNFERFTQLNPPVQYVPGYTPNVPSADIKEWRHSAPTEKTESPLHLKGGRAFVPDFAVMRKTI